MIPSPDKGTTRDVQSFAGLFKALSEICDLTRPKNAGTIFVRRDMLQVNWKRLYWRVRNSARHACRTRRVDIKQTCISLGSLWEHGYSERFNGTLRREVLNAKWFTTIKRAQIVFNYWSRHCNHTRPHQALKTRPPVPAALLEKPLFSGPDSLHTTTIPRRKILTLR